MVRNNAHCAGLVKAEGGLLALKKKERKYHVFSDTRSLEKFLFPDHRSLIVSISIDLVKKKKGDVF